MLYIIWIYVKNICGYKWQKTWVTEVFLRVHLTRVVKKFNSDTSDARLGTKLWQSRFFPSFPSHIPFPFSLHGYKMVAADEKFFPLQNREETLKKESGQ